MEGSAFDRADPSVVSRPRDEVTSTLVIQTAFLGDVVLTLPLIQHLAGQFGPVDIVVTPAAAPLLAGEPAIRRVITYDKRGQDRGIAGLRRLARVLSAEGYARAFLPHRSLRSAALARVAGISRRIGFRGGVASLLYTDRVSRPVVGHESERLGSLGGCHSPTAAPWFSIPPGDREAARTWLDSQNIGGQFIVLAPGAAWATKRWPHFAELATTLDRPVVIIGGPLDRAAGEAIAKAAPSRVYNGAGQFSLTQSAAIIAQAAVVVSNDSVALHLAVALGRPVVAIVGPTGPAPGFAPIEPSGTVVAHPDLACRPCSRHGHTRCPLGHHRCMRELGVDRVLREVTAAIGR